MTRRAETQAYLDAMKSPATLRPDTAFEAIHVFIEPLGRLREQVVTWSRMLQLSHVTEEDPILVGKYEACFQRFAAIQREAERAEVALRAIISCLRECAAADREMREIAEKAGYDP